MRSDHLVMSPSDAGGHWKGFSLLICSGMEAEWKQQKEWLRLWEVETTVITGRFQRDGSWTHPCKLWVCRYLM